MIIRALFFVWLGIARVLDALVHGTCWIREHWLRQRCFREMRRERFDQKVQRLLRRTP